MKITDSFATTHHLMCSIVLQTTRFCHINKQLFPFCGICQKACLCKAILTKCHWDHSRFRHLTVACIVNYQCFFFPFKILI